MPTRKQRRRRAKDRRHEWEYVYVDDEGHEVEVEEEPAPAKPGGAGKQATRSSGRPASRTPAKVGPGRKVDPPSWHRTFRRAAIFAPVMLIVIYLLKPKDASPAALIVQLVVLLLFFIPFSYFMDSLLYRSYRKRIGDPIKPAPRRR
jgi:hypothetical protein